jgi:hypothetical protein
MIYGRNLWRNLSGIKCSKCKLRSRIPLLDAYRICPVSIQRYTANEELIHAARGRLPVHAHGESLCGTAGIVFMIEHSDNFALHITALWVMTDNHRCSFPSETNAHPTSYLALLQARRLSIPAWLLQCSCPHRRSVQSTRTAAATNTCNDRHQAELTHRTPKGHT